MEKFKKIKEFVNNKLNKDQKTSTKSQVYNAILTLYAGDDVEEVFSDLTRLYNNYP